MTLCAYITGYRNVIYPVYCGAEATVDSRFCEDHQEKGRVQEDRALATADVLFERTQDAASGRAA